MADWATIAEVGTAAGTLVLAFATFGATRSANRSARIAERAFEARLRPVLVPSRLEDPAEKIMWGDQHWTRLLGGRASVEVGEEVVYLTMSLRNVGSGMAVIHAWWAEPSPGFPLEVPRNRQVRGVRHRGPIRRSLQFIGAGTHRQQHERAQHQRRAQHDSSERRGAIT